MGEEGKPLTFTISGKSMTFVPQNLLTSCCLVKGFVFKTSTQKILDTEEWTK